MPGGVNLGLAQLEFGLQSGFAIGAVFYVLRDALNEALCQCAQPVLIQAFQGTNVVQGSGCKQCG